MALVLLDGTGNPYNDTEWHVHPFNTESAVVGNLTVDDMLETLLEPAVQCDGCGTHNQKHARFCRSCGWVLLRE